MTDFSCHAQIADVVRKLNGESRAKEIESIARELCDMILAHNGSERGTRCGGLDIHRQYGRLEELGVFDEVSEFKSDDIANDAEEVCEGEYDFFSRGGGFVHDCMKNNA